MTPERQTHLLLQTLAHFARWSLRDHEGRIDPHFAWPSELLPLRDRFKGYTWGQLTEHPRAMLWAIAPLGARWPYDLIDLEPAIFEPATQSHATQGHASQSPLDADLQYFLVLEILNPRAVRASLPMFIERRDWYLLDEHLLQLH